jgi:hypothetical protein
MGLGMTTVFMGSVGEAAAICAMLEARGIPAYIPDELARTLVPFDVGGLMVLDRAVQVPESAAERAREYIAGHHGEGEFAASTLEGSDPVGALREGEAELPADYFAGPPEEERERRAAAAALGRRILWASILPIGLPFVLLQIGPYLRAVELLKEKPSQHRLTIQAALLSPFWCAGAWLPVWYYLLPGLGD